LRDGDPGDTRLNEGFGNSPNQGELWWNTSCQQAVDPDWDWKGEYWMTGQCGRGSGISFSVKPNGKSCFCPGCDPNDCAMAAASRHPGGVNVVMCDGSVQFVSESIDFRLWSAMGSRDGQESTN
jgi:prepilin-type processing-associated H-X9-DG protein